jgi:hypothetical protein
MIFFRKGEAASDFDEFFDLLDFEFEGKRVRDVPPDRFEAALESARAALRAFVDRLSLDELSKGYDGAFEDSPDDEKFNDKDVAYDVLLHMLMRRFIEETVDESLSSDASRRADAAEKTGMIAKRYDFSGVFQNYYAWTLLNAGALGDVDYCRFAAEEIAKIAERNPHLDDIWDSYIKALYNLQRVTESKTRPRKCTPGSMSCMTAPPPGGSPWTRAPPRAFLRGRWRSCWDMRKPSAGRMRLSICFVTWRSGRVAEKTFPRPF